MGKVHLLYCRNHHWSTPLLRLAMWSPWSHVALIMGDESNTIIDATFHHGVARRDLIKVLDDCSFARIKAIDCPDPAAAFDWARSQLGKPYDTWGVAGIGLHRNWQRDDAWFCSEFAEAALAAGGNLRFEADLVRRVTPQHSWMVRSPILTNPNGEPQ